MHHIARRSGAVLGWSPHRCLSEYRFNPLLHYRTKVLPATSSTIGPDEKPQHQRLQPLRSMLQKIWLIQTEFRWAIRCQRSRRGRHNGHRAAFILVPLYRRRGRRSKKRSGDKPAALATCPWVNWWVLRGSNSRPTPCKGAALPTELSTHAFSLCLFDPACCAWLSEHKRASVYRIL